MAAHNAIHAKSLPATVTLIILGYYAASTLNSVLTKQILTSFPRPLTVTLWQQLFSSLYSVLHFRVITGRWLDLQRHARRVMPVAVALVIALVAYRAALLQAAVSFAQVVKTLQPLFAAGVCAILLGERTPPMRLGALLLLVAGVGLASATEVAPSSRWPATLARAHVADLRTHLPAGGLPARRIPPRSALGAGAGGACCTRQAVPWLQPRQASLARQARQAALGDGALRPRRRVRDRPTRAPVGRGRPALSRDTVPSGHVRDTSTPHPQVDLPRAMRPDYSTVGLLLLNGCCNLADKLLSFWLLCLLASPVSAAVVSVVKRVIIVAAAALWSAASAGLAA